MTLPHHASAPRRLRLALDPAIVEARGPELTWTWRTILTALGYAWLEVPPDAECDIAHLATPPAAPTAALWIFADGPRWMSNRARVLRAVREHQGWSRLQFAGEQSAVPAVRGTGAGSAHVDHDVVFDLFWLGTAQAEDGWSRDSHGKPQPDSVFEREQLPTRALGSATVTQIGRALREAGWAPIEAPWPQGKRAAACLTHDVDYPEVVRWLEPARVLRRRGLRGARAALDVARGRRTTWHFDSWLDREEHQGTMSAFYFVARRGSLVEYATRTPDSFYDIRSHAFRQLFQRLAAHGAEIGLHASYRASESPEMFAAEKARLEDCAGQPVTGLRHHYLRLHPDHPEDTLLLHERLGFSYDTTLGYERHLGWRNGLAWPFRPFHRALRRELKSMQLPFAWMDSQLFAYRAQNPGNREELLSMLAARTAEQEGCLVVNIHDYVYDDELFPGWASTYFRLVEHLARRGDFWIATPRVIAAHWSARAERITRASQGVTGQAASADTSAQVML